MTERKKKRDVVGDLLQLAAFAIAVVAIVTELRKPAGEREWHGSVGPVPYDFRKPTLERLRSRLWSPNSALIQPHAFGVGWTVNIGRVVGILRSRIS